jgi:hypothetical protein
MKLWTIQNYNAYQEMLKTGILKANENYVFERDFFEPIYDWLFKEMVKRIGAPPELSIKYPIWAWYQSDGKRQKPDMRRSSHSAKGEHVVRMTIEVDDKDVVFSDFDLYHYPLNYWHLPLNEDESEYMDEKYPSLYFDQMSIRELLLQPSKDPLFCDIMLKSWERIFNLSLEDDGYIFGSIKEKTIQATMWQLKIENVIKVEEFIAR